MGSYARVMHLAIIIFIFKAYGFRLCCYSQSIETGAYAVLLLIPAEWIPIMLNKLKEKGCYGKVKQAIHLTCDLCP